MIDQLNLTLKMFALNLTVLTEHAHIVHQIDFKCEQHSTSGGSCNALDCSFILYLYTRNMH